jgi:hypothetical protein
MCIGRTHHIALLNHPLVYEQLRQWVATPPARLAALARDTDRDE